MTISRQALTLCIALGINSPCQSALTLIDPDTTGNLEYVSTPWSFMGGSINDKIYDVNGPLQGAAPAGDPSWNLHRSGFGFSGILRVEAPPADHSDPEGNSTERVCIFADTHGAATLTSSNLIGAGTSASYLPRIGDVITYGMTIDTDSDEALNSFGRISLLIGNSFTEVGILTQNVGDRGFDTGTWNSRSRNPGTSRTLSNSFTLDASNIIDASTNLQFTGGVDQEDYKIFGDRFFVTVEPIPEPSSALLALLGLTLLTRRSRT